MNIKSNLQAAAFRKLCVYLDDNPDEARALAESIFLDLLKHLTITQTEEWVIDLDRMAELNMSWSAETDDVTNL